jgi:hypothetical protein
MRNILLVAAFLLSGATAVCAQEDSTRYIFGLPVSEDDTASQVVANDLEPKNRYTPVSANDLPEKLRNVLQKKEQYRGWQDSTIYLERNTGLYIVPIKYDEGVKLFGFSENGHPVTYNEIVIRDDH